MDAQLHVHNDGVEILRDGEEVACFVWSDVREVVAYKRDFSSFDEICLAFGIHDRGEWVEVSESDTRFSEMFAALERNFPSVPKNWYVEIMLPAFEVCPRVLFRSDDGSGGSG